MKRTVSAICGLALLAGAGAVAARIGTIDNVPAATLLLPYFEVDLGDPNGITTLLSINNASAEETLAHVVVWTDLGVPILDFNLYLTGYDVASINLRQVLAGNLPGSTPGAGQGLLSAASTDPLFDALSSCAGILPPAPLTVAERDEIRAAATGQPSPSDSQCRGTDRGDNVARGYVTVDATRECTQLLPGEAGYFVNGGLLGVASNNNVLWGDWFMVDSANNFAQGDALVHIEADGANGQTATPNEYTFYGRYVGWDARDNREPLGSRFRNSHAAPALRCAQDQEVTGDT